MDITSEQSKAIEIASKTGHTLSDSQQVLAASGGDLDLALRMLEYAATQDRSKWTQVAIASRMARNTRNVIPGRQTKM